MINLLDKILNSAKFVDEKAEFIYGLFYVNENEIKSKFQKV